MNYLNLEIKGFGVINEAKINLNKINIVGGVNSSGKSTVSRFLYCFLKANVLNYKPYIKHVIVTEMHSVFPHQIAFEEDFSEALKKYKKLKKESGKDNSKFEFIEYLMGLLNMSAGYLASLLIKDLVNNENIDCFENGFAKLYNSSFESFMGNQCVADAKFNKEGLVEYCGDTYDTCSDFYVIKTKGRFWLYDVQYIDSVSLLDLYHFQENLSLFEPYPKKLNYEKYHTNYLMDSILRMMYPEPIDSFDSKVRHVLNKINKFTHAELNDGSNNHKSAFSFKKIPISHGENVGDESKDLYMGTVNTSSGIKQIAIIQLLLQYEQLNEGSFLIIDEPEVNLHPEWQFKFAEILVLLVKELNIQIYINSHSPMFIEAMDAFIEYYDMENDVNYYLAEKSEENENKFDFNKINSNELYKIYDNLGNGYKLINQLRLRKRLGR